MDEIDKAIQRGFKKGWCRKCLQKIDPRQYLWEKDGDFYHECCKPEGAVKIR